MVAIKNNTYMHAVWTNQIADILHFHNKAPKHFISGNYCGKSTESLGALFNFFFYTSYEVKKFQKIKFLKHIGKSNSDNMGILFVISSRRSIFF